MDEWAVPGVPRPGAPAAVTAPPVSAPLRELRQAVLGVLAAPATGAPQDLAVLLTVVEQLRGRALRELGQLDACGTYRAEAVSAAAWLRRRQHLGEDTARAAVRLAGRMREDLPELLGGLESGSTTLEHVRAVAAGTCGLDADLVAQAQPALLELVRAAEPAVVRRQLRERAEAISPELARDADRRQRARQGFFADSVAGAGVLLGGQLAGEDGAVLLHGLDLCVEADRATGDTRTLPCRRAAVLVDWARTAAARVRSGAGQDVPGLRTHLLITCTPEQLAATAQAHAHAQLTGQPEVPGRPDPLDAPAAPAALHGEAALAVLTGTVPAEPSRLATTGATLLPEALRRLACDASVSLLAGHPLTTGVLPSFPRAARPVPAPAEILYAGRTLRTVTAAQLKALVVRDRTCIVAGCRRRPSQCAAHHVRHWLDGGPTDLTNLVLLCHQHHHDHHDRGHPLQHRDGRWLTRTGWATAPP